MKVSGVFEIAVAAMPLVVVMGFVLGLPLLVTVWRLKRRRRRIAESRAAGTIADISPAFGQRMPMQYAALSRVGTGGPAPMTLDDRILRASVGVRLFVLGLSAVIAAFTLIPALAPVGFHEAMAELPGPTLIPQLVMLAAVGNGLLYVFGSEARYNRDKLISTRMMFSRREYRWKDLDWIGDTGSYDLVLHFQPGGKAKVLKHCKGIEDFKMFAMDQIQRNRATRA
jgi:hypothetical protein